MPVEFGEESRQRRFQHFRQNARGRHHAGVPLAIKALDERQIGLTTADHIAHADPRRGLRQAQSARASALRGDVAALGQQRHYLGQMVMRNPVAFGDLPDLRRLRIAQAKEHQNAQRVVCVLGEPHGLVHPEYRFVISCM